ncbi:MAG: pyridoxamine 5'-phosphate oxidase family protein [Candidatus Zixiibacteriota bacterium]
MYKEIRRKDRILDKASALALLDNGEYGVLSTVDENNQPYGIPVNYTVIDNTIFVHSAPEGHKLDNIQSNSKVSFCVVGRTRLLPDKFSINYKSVIVFGSASIVDDQDKREALISLVAKYSPEHMDSGGKYIDNLIDKTVVIKVSIDHITGKQRE